MLRVRLLVVVLGTMLVATVGRAAAATITVNTTADSNAAGDCSLRQAIADVDSPGSNMSGCPPAAFGANTIVLGPNSYQLFAPELKVAATVTSLTITGAGEGKTTIDQAPVNPRFFPMPARVLEIAAGANVAIDDLTISGGRAPGGAADGAGGFGAAGGTGSNGGGILNQGTLTLTDVRVSGNIAGNGGVGAGGGVGSGAVASGGAGGAGGDGGGIYNSGMLTLTGATVDNNYAGRGGDGGPAAVAMAATGGAGGDGGDGGAGGGIENQGGTVTITDSTVNGNTSGAGGHGGTGGGGTASGGAGGAGGDTGSGGGIDSVGGSVTITNSTFASNTAGDGGSGGGGGAGTTTGGDGGDGGAAGSGGAISATGPTNLMLQSDTFAGNSIGSAGGGGAGGAGTTSGAKGAGGGAGTGGGVLDDGKFVTMQNTLLASDPGGNCDTPSVTNGGHNLSFGDSSCPSTFLRGDPNLGPLQDNGGPSRTIPLGSGSAAIDQIPATGAGCPATDQRGVARPAGAMCDIGAYEVAPPTATTLKATAIKNTSATLNASVTPNAGPSAVVAFEYGTTTKYGKTVVVANVSGVAPAAVMAQITMLKAGMTYHYRVTVTTIDGSANGADATFRAGTVPLLRRLRVRGKTITYTDSEAARTTFKIVRGKGRRAKTVASFSHRDRKGTNRVRLRSGGVKRGRYTLVATARFRGQAGAPVRATIRIR